MLYINVGLLMTVFAGMFFPRLFNSKYSYTYMFILWSDLLNFCLTFTVHLFIAFVFFFSFGHMFGECWDPPKTGLPMSQVPLLSQK